MRYFILQTLFFLTVLSCKSQDKTKALNADELTRTSLTAMNFIKQNDYLNFKNLFAEDIVKNVKEEQLQAVFKFINDLVAKEGIPNGDNIQPRLTMKTKGVDTLYINVIAFIFNNSDSKTNPYKQEITFSYLEKYGTSKIAGINVTADPLNARGLRISLVKLDSLILRSADIKLYRVYYDEGEHKKTQFGKNKGVFALEGDKAKLVSSKLNLQLDNVFKELQKVKFEKIEEFRTALNRGDKTQFIQAEFMFENLPYGIFIYLPIKTDTNYKDKIIVRQQQAANLGYQYYIDIKGNELLIEHLKQIIRTDWKGYYVDEP